jgi:hypothetical protein
MHRKCEDKGDKMDKSKLTWGIVCLVIAAALATANLTLPPESLMFQVGEKNMPWIPPIVLAIIGVILLINVNQKGEDKMTEDAKNVTPADPAKVALNKRFETVGWGLFLIMLGGFMFVPDSSIEKGFWSIGIGLIFLGLNAARYFNGIRMSGFTTLLGVLSLLGGILQLLGWRSMEGAFFLIILGAYLLLKPVFDKRQLFGKAEQS